MNFNEVTVNGKKLDDVTFVMPGSSARFNLPQGVHGGAMTFTIINDYGGPGKKHNANI